MPKFGNRSILNCNYVDTPLQHLLNEVIKHYDCSVTSGYRGKEKQNEYFQLGLSKVEYPNSKHNVMPSQAVDVVPYPVDWEDWKRFYHFGGFVLGIAKSMKLEIRWGGIGT